MLSFVLVAPNGFMMTARTKKRVLEKSFHRIGSGDVPYKIYKYDTEKTWVSVDDGGYFIYDGYKPKPTGYYKPVTASRRRRGTRRRPTRTMSRSRTRVR